LPAQADVEDAVDVRSMLSEEIRGEPNLVVGHLDNGFQYVILPNKLPPTRFEAHLEIHAGSVDELPNEQGIAHLVEHVTFLGSKRRENLLGTGARANAYTDFHHTVFHVHAPITNSNTGAPMLPQVSALETAWSLITIWLQVLWPGQVHNHIRSMLPGVESFLYYPDVILEDVPPACMG
jgi:hypothetical protein